MVQGGTGETRRLSLRRGEVSWRPVDGALLDGGVAHIRIRTFYERAGQDFIGELARLEREAGGALRGVLLDLRGNPGGYVGQAVEVDEG